MKYKIVQELRRGWSKAEEDKIKYIVLYQNPNDENKWVHAASDANTFDDAKKFAEAHSASYKETVLDL